MDSLITINNIDKSFGSKQILSNVSFNLYKKQIVGLVGLNGAGKSTLISILLGLIKPDNGSINFNSTEIGVMLQEVSMPSQIRVYELIDMVIKFSKNPKTLSEILEISNLQKQKNLFCSNLSGGQQRQLQFALAISNNPQLLILDEPTVGMDFKAKKNFFNYLKSISNDVSILLTSHDFGEIEELSNRILILNNSQIICDKKAKEISNISFKILKISLDKIDLDLLDKRIITYSKYKIHNEYIEIYTKDITTSIKQLSHVGLSFNDFEIINLKLDEVITNIIDGGVYHE